MVKTKTVLAKTKTLKKYLKTGLKTKTGLETFITAIIIIDFYFASNFLEFGHSPKETACTKLWGAPPEKISGYVP